MNSRLDEMQAAILRARLPRLAGWTARRRALAARYRGAARAARRSTLPPECDPGHVYHLFVVRAPTARSATALQAHLAARGIETLIHYPVPIPRQPAFAARAAGRLSGRRRGVRRGAVAAAPSRDCTTTTSTAVADAANACDS